MNTLLLNTPPDIHPSFHEALSLLGKVYSLDFKAQPNRATQIKAAIDGSKGLNLDLIAGCGEGGWLASHVGARIGVPFVALDATYLSPTEDLPMAKDGCGCILVSEGYKHQGGQAVLEGLADAYGPKVISDALLLNPKQLAEMLDDFVERAGFVYGF
ncbi:hypothetical protein [Marinospirillum insulare]|uniref:Uncharacterized protein n=1 Tax=Marinospirillum insulare TaxID=217169 RepID=A0ABQ5ZXY1_9GAMM|nr:hypothetical protein [Marinospirillum insulare]GLR62795.1 hypothetical protein GCM10007878_02300 [Marinospirillum insulare]